MNKKLIIALLVIIIALAGCFIYFKIDNSKYLFKAYLEEHNGEYTLVVKNKDYFSFNEMWKIEDTQMDNGHIKGLPWVLDSRAKKITKVDIQDNIKLRSFSFWFYNLTNLKEIVGLEKIDTSDLLSMSGTFYNCNLLTEIDLSSFKTGKVTNMSGLFYGCNNLKTVYVGNDWSVENVVYSEDMFKGCTNLVGSNETEYNEYIVDKSFAQVDDLDNAGYLTLKN